MNLFIIEVLKVLSKVISSPPEGLSTTGHLLFMQIYKKVPVRKCSLSVGIQFFQGDNILWEFKCRKLNPLSVVKIVQASFLSKFVLFIRTSLSELNPYVKVKVSQEVSNGP